MKWIDKAKAVKVGDVVAYSRKFLLNSGAFTEHMRDARGIVKEVFLIGDEVLALVDWESANLPPRVEMAALRRVGEKKRE